MKLVITITEQIIFFCAGGITVTVFLHFKLKSIARIYSEKYGVKKGGGK